MSLLWVVSGVFLVAGAENYKISSIILSIIGILLVLFYLPKSIYRIKKMFDKNPGLIIDENGIFDNSGTVNAGLIKWSDITKIETKKINC